MSEEKTIVRRRILVLAMITVFFLSCAYYMNRRFDRLSRYPYQNKEKRALIDRYLNDEEINYIIAYSIEPNYFIRYIACDGFNIYDVDYYHKIAEKGWQLNDSEVVSLCEYSLNKYHNVDFLLSVLPNYSYNQLMEWMKQGDKYIPESTLITDPYSYMVCPDLQHSLYNFVPYDLKSLSVLSMDETLMLREEALNALSSMCSAIEEENEGACGYLKVNHAYVSYDEQASLDNADLPCLNALPGHGEHQTGLCLDVTSSKGSFENSPLQSWLMLNAYDYGFLPNENGHLRYVGLKAAQDIKSSGLDLKAYIEAH